MAAKYSEDKRVIKAVSIEFKERDIIVIDSWEDFQWLTRRDDCIWELENAYYAIAADVTYVFHKNNKKLNSY